MWRLCMLLLARVWRAHNFIFCRWYHIMPPIDAHEIFSQYDIYFSTDSHFAQNLKMALLSLSLNLEAQYRTRSWTWSGGIYNQRNSWSSLCRMKVINVFNNLHFEIYICTWNLPNVMKSSRFQYEIQWISYANEAICIWNLPDFMHEIWWVS